MRVGSAWLIGLLSLAGLCPGSAAAAQQGTAGSLSGRVIDAGTGAPVAGANVMLIRRPGGAAEPDEAVPPGAVLAERGTDARGRYAFDGIEAGPLLLRVQRLGYHTVTLEVRLGASPGAQVSVALEVEPVLLAPLEVTTAGEAEIATMDGTRIALDRVSAIRLRQRRFMSPDSRVLTPTDIEESVTLGEMDIFRALQRLPGVTTRDDYSAELWTRGADWGETRVYMDGLPLFNPLHGGGVLSGMSTRSLAAAFFHPGVRPVEYSEGGAAVLDLSSRSGLGTQEMDGGAEISLASGQAWATAPLGERAGWAAAARRSWVDLAARAASDDPADHLPYDFWDVQLRLDAEVWGGVRLELNGLWERDQVRGDIPDLLHGTEGEWGNGSVGVTARGSLGGLDVRQLLGTTGYFARIRTFESELDDRFSAPTAEPVDHAVRYTTLSGSISPRGTETPAWQVGYDLVHQSTSYVGPEPWPYSAEPPDLPEVDRRAELTRAAVWARRRARLGERLEMEGSLRVAVGGGEAGAPLFAPVGSIRYTPTSFLTLHAGVGRYAQLMQSPTSVGPLLETVLQTGRLWVLAGEDAPAIDARLATLGAEAWLSSSWLASATAYVRRTRGLLLPDPTPGFLVQRRPLVEGAVSARGLDLSFRRVSGRITGSVGYSLADADASAAGIDFPAPADRTHALDLTLLARLSEGWRLGAAFTHLSGAPYTRVLSCSADGCMGVELDAPFRRRSPSYASLDLSIEYEHRFRGWGLGFFLQARNVLGHENDVTYRSTSQSCAQGMSAPPCQGESLINEDGFVDGIPTLPVFGLRVTF